MLRLRRRRKNGQIHSRHCWASMYGQSMSCLRCILVLVSCSLTARNLQCSCTIIVPHMVSEICSRAMVPAHAVVKYFSTCVDRCPTACQVETHRLMCQAQPHGISMLGHMLKGLGQQAGPPGPWSLGWRIPARILAAMFFIHLLGNDCTSNMHIYGASVLRTGPHMRVYVYYSDPSPTMSGQY
jgi:hypothetical protein